MPVGLDRRWGVFLRSADGVTNDTTAVTMVAAPPTGTVRLIRLLTAHNPDSGTLDVRFIFDNNGTERIFQRDATLAVNGTMLFGDTGEILILDATDKSIKIDLQVGAAANQVQWTAHYEDAS